MPTPKLAPSFSVELYQPLCYAIDKSEYFYHRKRLPPAWHADLFQSSCSKESHTDLEWDDHLNTQLPEDVAGRLQMSWVRMSKDPAGIVPEQISTTQFWRRTLRFELWKKTTLEVWIRLLRISDSRRHATRACGKHFRYQQVQCNQLHTLSSQGGRAQQNYERLFKQQVEQFHLHSRS
jgi:hypothetical protein